MSTWSATPAARRALARQRACGSRQRDPGDVHAVLARGVDRRTRPSRSRRRARARPAAARAWCRRARAWSPAPPRASSRRARRSRTSTSSTRPGTARRTRWRGRSGGGPRACRAAIAVARGPSGAAPSPAPSGRRAARPPHRGQRRSAALVAGLDRRRRPVREQRERRVDVVDVDAAADVGAADAELAGRAQHVAERLRRAEREGGPAAVRSAAARCRPTARRVNGRSGSASASASRSGPVASSSRRALGLALRGDAHDVPRQARSSPAPRSPTPRGRTASARSPWRADVGNA